MPKISSNNVVLEPIDDVFENLLFSFGSSLSPEDASASLLFSSPGYMIEQSIPPKPTRPLNHVSVSNFIKKTCRPARRIDDSLVLRMKKPIELPDENYRPNYITGLNMGWWTNATPYSIQRPSSSAGVKPRERALSPAQRGTPIRSNTSYDVDFSGYTSDYSKVNRHPRSSTRSYRPVEPLPSYHNIPTLPPLSPARPTYVH